ncbi:MAG: hypothetical protein F4181_17650 [Proteobacteria bacterium]|nr:hypothetical protein [Pseudomonadota bacterium]
MSAGNLYREETYTDRQVGSLQILTPVKKDGSTDFSRQRMFVGQTQILTPAGALPLSFEIEAKTLEEAIEKFGDSAQNALTGTMQRLEEMRREAASSIIVPGSDPMAAPGGGLQVR